MKISSISIQGFQSHTDSNINLAGGLTVITGESDHGKTAILRAVRWVCLGEPSGDAFVNDKTGQASVTLTLEDGHRINKIRKGTQTTYIITTPTRHIQEYVMAKVPEEVSVLTGIRQDNFGEFQANLNFAFQLEAPFLLSETPSTGAKVLGAIANVDDVDGALKDATGEVYKLREQRSSAQQRIEEISEELKQFENLDELEDVVVTVEYLLNNIEQMQNRLTILQSLQRKLFNCKEKIEFLEQKLLDLAVVPALAEDLRNIEASQQRYEKLLTAFSNLHKYQVTINNLKSRLEHYKCLETYRQTIADIQARHDRLALLTKLDKQCVDLVSIRQNLEYKIQGLVVVDELKASLVFAEALSHSLDTIKHLEKRRFESALDVFRAVDKDAEAKYRISLLQKEYEDLWASVDCCPLDGEKFCKIHKEVK